MSEEFLGDRRKALEDEFFAKQNQQLLRQFRETTVARARHEALGLHLVSPTPRCWSNWRPSA
jgi:primosomal protein N'